MTSAVPMSVQAASSIATLPVTSAGNRLLGRVRVLGLSITDQVFVSGSNVVLNIVLARWLAKADYGVFAILFSLFTLVTGFHNALLIEPMSVLGGGVFRHCTRTYRRQMLWLHGCIVLGSLPVLTALARAFCPPAYSRTMFFFSLLSGMVAVLLYYVLRRAAYITGEYGRAAAAGAISISCALACLYLIRTFGHVSWATGFASQSVGASLACLAFVRRRETADRIHERAVSFRTVLLEHWRYGRWAVLTAVVFWLSAEAYSVLIGMILGSADAAGFRATQNLCMLLPNLATALSVLLLPQAARTYAERGARELHNLVMWFVAASTGIAVILSVVLFIGGARVLTILYGPAYASFSRIMPPLICNLILITASQGIQTGVRAFNRPQYIFHGFLVAGISTCSIGVLLTRWCGLAGASLGLCFSTLTFLIVLTWRYKALLRVPVGVRR